MGHERRQRQVTRGRQLNGFQQRGQAMSDGGGQGGTVESGGLGNSVAIDLGFAMDSGKQKSLEPEGLTTYE